MINLNKVQSFTIQDRVTDKILEFRRSWYHGWCWMLEKRDRKGNVLNQVFLDEFHVAEIMARPGMIEMAEINWKKIGLDPTPSNLVHTI